jgi:hypothetical protein
MGSFIFKERIKELFKSAKIYLTVCSSHLLMGLDLSADQSVSFVLLLHDIYTLLLLRK